MLPFDTVTVIESNSLVCARTFNVQIAQEFSPCGHHDWPVKPVIRQSAASCMEFPTTPAGFPFRHYASRSESV
jgi:hypothetical protein